MSKLLEPLHALRRDKPKEDLSDIYHYIAKNFLPLLPVASLPLMLSIYKQIKLNKLKLYHSLQETLGHISKLNQLIYKAYIKDTTPEPHDGWEFVCDSSSIQMTTGFYAQIWVHNTYKQLIYACSGTKIDFVKMNCSLKSKCLGALDLAKDVLNDIRIFLHKPPFQYKYGMEPFIKWSLKHLTDLGFRLSEHEIFLTGHSLGAIVADMGAFKMMHMHEDLRVKAITMENPGSLPAIHDLAASLKRAGNFLFNIDDIRDNFIVFNNTPNWVNTCSQQLGRVYQLDNTKLKPKLPFIEYIPIVIRDIVSAGFEHFEAHDKTNFDNIKRVFHVEEWPTGLFDEFVRDQTQPLREKIQYTIQFIGSWIDNTTLSLCLGSAILGDFTETDPTEYSE